MKACTTTIIAIILIVLVTGVFSRHHKFKLKRHHGHSGHNIHKSKPKEKHGMAAFKEKVFGPIDRLIHPHSRHRRSARDEILTSYDPAVEYPADGDASQKMKPVRAFPGRKEAAAPKAIEIPKPRPTPKISVAPQPANIDSNLLQGNAGIGVYDASENGQPVNPDIEPTAVERIDDKGNVISAGVDSNLTAPKIRLQSEDSPVIFTISNSNTKRRWSQLPYREKFQWSIPSAPCYEFDMRVPDERDGHSLITLCIYRQRLDLASGSGIISYEDDKHVDLFEQREIKVNGQVIGFPASTVVGRIVQTYFYGEISFVDRETGEDRVYVVEEVKLLSKLFHRSRKLFHNIVEVVSGGTTTSAKSAGSYNAVVTRGNSLLSFLIMNDVNRDNLSPMPVVVLTTKHASYIMPGQPRVAMNEKGELNFDSPDKTRLALTGDGSVVLSTPSRVYTFRPNGTSMMKEGVTVTGLQKKEGSLAISAVSNTLTYGCVLPSHSFSKSRKGGYLCKVCLAADRLFQQKYLELVGINNTTPMSFLGDVIDRVSWIYRPVDWNGDGKPDNIGLDFDAQFTEWKYEDDGNLIISKETLDVLFESLTGLDFSDCCLGIAYTMKKFPNDIYAKSASSTPKEPGGICSFRTDGRSKNVILISAHSKTGESLKAATPSQLIYLTAHEIGKAFGSGIDTSGQPGCDSWGGSTIGGKKNKAARQKHYLLWPDVFRPNITLQEKSFSTCSKKAIVTSLDSCKSSCFEVDLHPFCGNGVKEEGEECDCGSEYNCSKQKCCYGRTGTYPCRKTGRACGNKPLDSSGNRVISRNQSLLTSVVLVFAWWFLKMFRLA